MLTMSEQTTDQPISVYKKTICYPAQVYEEYHPRYTATFVTLDGIPMETTYMTPEHKTPDPVWPEWTLD